MKLTISVERVTTHETIVKLEGVDPDKLLATAIEIAKQRSDIEWEPSGTNYNAIVTEA